LIALIISFEEHQLWSSSSYNFCQSTLVSLSLLNQNIVPPQHTKYTFFPSVTDQVSHSKPKCKIRYKRFQAVTEVTMTIVVCHVTPCSLLKMFLPSGATCCHHGSSTMNTFVRNAGKFLTDFTASLWRLRISLCKSHIITSAGPYQISFQLSNCYV
jgi:hypothetical protein